MEDSLSSSYDGPSVTRRKHHRNSSRGGPEGDSMGAPKLPTQNTSTPTSVPSKPSNKSKLAKNLDLSGKMDSKTSPQKKNKRKNKSQTFQDGDGNSFESMDSKRSRVSSDNYSIESRQRGARLDKSTGPPSTDVSWELAVEKARGLPDGAYGSPDNQSDMEEDEIDVDAPPPDQDKVRSPKAATAAGKTPRKANTEEARTKPLNVIQCVSKKIKQKKSKGSDSDSPKKSTKRRSDEKQQDASDQKKAKAEKKERKIQRKMHKSTHYDVAWKAKSYWGQLGRFDLPHEKRQQLSSDLYSLIKGKAKELIFAHDTSRVIQCMMKYGSQEHKNAIFEELREHIIDMSKSKYAKFFVRKLMKYGTKAQRNYVFRKLYGNVRKLIKHKEAAEIIECVYNDYANSSQRHALVEEFYGPSFSLFKTSDQKSLEQIIQSHPEKRDSILSNMKETLCGLVEKTVLQYSIIHRVFWEFFSHAPDKLRSEMIETVREGIIHMLHTRDGSRVAMICLWHGSTKDRKVIVKSFKTYVAKICKEEYGHLVLLAILDVVDDTKLVFKAMIEEMMKSVQELAGDQYGRKVLLYLLSPRDPLHFCPDIVKVLQQGDSNPHSKKDVNVRRQELLEFASRPLIQYAREHCKELVTTNSTIVLLCAIIVHAKGDPTDAMRAVSELAAEPFVAGSLENQHIVEHPAGHLTLKRLIKNDAQRKQRGESVLFAGILLDVLPEGALKSWAACNRGCFMLISLLELNHAEFTAKVCKELVPVKDSLNKMDFKGAQMLRSKLDLC